MINPLLLVYPTVMLYIHISINPESPMNQLKKGDRVVMIGVMGSSKAGSPPTNITGKIIKCFTNLDTLQPMVRVKTDHGDTIELSERVVSHIH